MMTCQLQLPPYILGAPRACYAPPGVVRPCAPVVAGVYSARGFVVWPDRLGWGRAWSDVRGWRFNVCARSQAVCNSSPGPGDWSAAAQEAHDEAAADRHELRLRRQLAQVPRTFWGDF